MCSALPVPAGALLQVSRALGEAAPSRGAFAVSCQFGGLNRADPRTPFILLYPLPYTLGKLSSQLPRFLCSLQLPAATSSFIHPAQGWRARVSVYSLGGKGAKCQQKFKPTNKAEEKRCFLQDRATQQPASWGRTSGMSGLGGGKCQAALHRSHGEAKHQFW